MASKSLLVALALTAGAAALAAPTLLSGQDGSGRNGGMMGGLGGAPWAGFDFAGADADGDGKITKDELAAYRNARVAGIDADGDNKISVAELTAKMTTDMQARIEARAKARVEAQDADGDGMLSVEELIAPPMAGRLFDRLDTDGDGAVSQDEIAAVRDRMGAMSGQRGQMGGHGKHGGMMEGHGGWFGDGGFYGWGPGMGGNQ